MFLDNSENFDNHLLNDINPIIYNYNPMTDIQRKFINGIIRKLQPKKILEVGVLNGGSSTLILNAIKDIKNSKLYSIDYFNYSLDNIDKEVGWVVKEYSPDLMDKWELYKGGLVSDFIEKIGYDIELCFLDAAHRNPGELLDYLMVLPFLSKRAIVVLHDISLHIRGIEYYTNSILFSAIKGVKLYPKTEDNGKGIANIGAIILDDNINDFVFDVFNLITLPWSYFPTNRDIVSIIRLFDKYYEKDLVYILKKSFLFNKKNLNRRYISWSERKKDLEKISKIVSLIPIRNIREKIKNKMIEKKINSYNDLLEVTEKDMEVFNDLDLLLKTENLISEIDLYKKEGFNMDNNIQSILK
ncbi:class I SAM-dependent methyltransferase [Brachyspira pilosicoli]|uniref:O-methyltransferase-like protein n=1 Tax=Brachyspira pilosicoli (strain ATCC BAA-1826 / 95/1000) TaxID=759914 RepID=D8IFW6_BRAP9|nr:class I SAM-dependent methyltransferase [Brachyspira pilosicoli]ADK30013.1 hypothetical protein BP951000_0004 [Brachyspira pilosicoli 95/1000]SUW07819.1 O-methyltransferase-like protein [Brachyspira pilosicoli]